MTNKSIIGPHSIEAEQSVLGAVMIEPTILDDLPALTREDFFEVKHGWIWEAYNTVAEDGLAIDPLTVSERLRAMGKLDDAGGLLYLNELMATTPTYIYAPTYAEIVRQAAIRRQLMTIGGKVANIARDEELTTDQALAEAERLVSGLALTGRNQESRPYADGLQSLIERLWAARDEDTPPGVPTGIKALDGIMGGLERGNLILLAGRPAVGKTAFSLNIAEHAARHSGVLFVSLEMSEEQLLKRLISIGTGIHHDKLRYPKQLTNEDYEAIGEYYAQANGRRLYIANTYTNTLSRIRAEARNIARRDGLDLVIIDYLQLIQAGTRYAGNRVQEVAQISAELKALARDLNIPVLALSQLSRAGDKQMGDRPRLSELRDSGSLEQDADIVILLSRQNGGVLVDVAKNRHAAPGEFIARWDGAVQRFA